MSASIIIPCYRNEQTLARTIDSLLAQRDFVKEILLIDDGSPDNTAAIAQQYAAQYPHLIQYHWQENQGPAKARNHGARLATGDFALFLDGDDALCEDALKTFHAVFEKNVQTQILIAGYRAIHATHQKARHIKAYQTSEDLLRAIWFGEFSINGGMVALRTPLLQRIQYPEHIRHGEDIVFFSHLIAQYGAQILPIISVDMYHHADSLRHQDASVLKEQDAFITLLFDARFLSPTLMAYQSECHARKLIALARTALRVHQKALARTYLKKAFALHPRSFLRFKTLKTCLKAC